MPLSRQSRQVLEGYRAYQRLGGPNIIWLIRRCLPSTLCVVAVSGAVLACTWLISDETAFIPCGLLVVGMVLGAGCQQIAYCVYTMRVWPVLSQIIDWQRVDEMLNAQE
jgi:hypothetical protein